MAMATLAIESYPQQAIIDSLKQAAQAGTEDTNAVKNYLKIFDLTLSDAMAIRTYKTATEAQTAQSTRAENARVFAERAYDLSYKLSWPTGQALGAVALSTYYMEFPFNLTKSAELLIEGLKIVEQQKDTVLKILLMHRLSLLYRNAEDFDNYLRYSKSAWSLSKLHGNRTLIQGTLYHVAESFLYLGIADSALVYYSDNQVMVNNIRDEDLLDIVPRWSSMGISKPWREAYAYYGLGGTHKLLNNFDIALSFLYKCAASAEKLQSWILFSDVYRSLMEVYLKTGKIDSSIVYAGKCLQYPEYGPNILAAYNHLANVYVGRNNDSAVRYFQLGVVLRDSMYSSDKRTELKYITKNEEDRQEELRVQVAKAKEERSRTLQYAIIAIGLICFLIVYFLLTQSIIVKSGLVRFLGVLALLLIFEFINLWLHPLIGHFTHHSPILTFLIMVCIAALLIPSHHKMEHWITTKMVEKNKRIRLAAAKRTIQQLEGRK